MTTFSWMKAWRALGLAMLLLAGAPAVQALEILVAAEEDTPALQRFVVGLQAIRPDDRVRFSRADELPAPAAFADDIRLILIGPQLLDWRQRSVEGPPSLVLHVNRVEGRQILGKRQPPGITLLWSDPPLSRQLNLLRLLLPQARRIGVLYSNDSAFLIQELRQLAPEDLQINAQFWANTRDPRTLSRLLDQSDVLLGLDDPQLYNPHTIKTLLLTSYSRHQALIGPTAAFVHAGSLVSTYSDQQDWLETLDSLLSQPPVDWPTEQYPSRFKVLGNTRVALSLGIPMADPHKMEQALQRLEAAR